MYCIIGIRKTICIIPYYNVSTISKQKQKIKYVIVADIISVFGKYKSEHCGT